MGRILGIDYGLKRVGVAVTDPLQIIASPLETVPEDKIIAYISKYISTEQVEKIVVGMPVNLQNKDTDATEPTRKFISVLRKKLDEISPSISIVTIDERFTSSMAFSAILESGIGKKKRRDKNLVDKISASLILQSYLGK